MDDKVLERFVRDYINSVTADEVVPSWQWVALEHDGSIYACDHCVYRECRQGNIRQKSLGDMV